MAKRTKLATSMKKARVAAGLTQRQCALVAEMHESAWNRYERGDQVPRPEMLAKILRALPSMAAGPETL